MKFFYTIIIFILLLSCNSYSQEMNLDSIKVKLDQMKKDSVWIEKTGLLFDRLIERDMNKAEILNHEIFNVSRKLRFQKGIALAYKERGDIFWYKLQFDSAKLFLDTALAVYQKSNDKKGIASVLTSMGINYVINRQELKGAEMLYKSLELCENSDDKYLIALNYENLGLINDRVKNYQKAESYHRKALELFKQINNIDKIVFVQYNYGSSLMESKRFQEAINYLKEGAGLCEKVKNNFFLTGFYEGIGNCYLMMDTMNSSFQSVGKDSLIHQALYYLQKSEKEIYKYGYNENLANINAKIGFIYFRMGDYVKALSYNEKALELAKKYHLLNVLTDASRQIFEIYVALRNPAKALEFHQQYKFWNDSMYSAAKSNKIEQLYEAFEFEKKEALAKAEQDKKDMRQKNIRNSTFAGLAGVLIFSFVLYRQRNRISKERKRSDDLLLNILPSEIAEELKNTGTAKAKRFGEVTVMFTDFKNFTRTSEHLSAEELVKEINYCYSAFDNIITKYNIEKIKTIGDSYMAAGGLPVENKTNSKDTVMAALEIKKFMEQYKQEKQKENKPYFEIRIGIHTGPVVAGIVGIKKFAYDIWGDTVNIASRMESSGEAGKVNISGVTYELIKDKFTCIHRGKIAAKNKGEIDMYFVEGVK